MSGHFWDTDLAVCTGPPHYPTDHDESEENWEDLPEIFGVDELAGVLDLHANTVYSACQTDDIPHFRAGRQKIRFKKSAVENWMIEGGMSEFE